MEHRKLTNKCQFSAVQIKTIVIFTLYSYFCEKKGGKPFGVIMCARGCHRDGKFSQAGLNLQASTEETLLEIFHKVLTIDSRLNIYYWRKMSYKCHKSDNGC